MAQLPKEKAQELFTNYRFVLSIPNAPLGELKDDIAKECAIIAVDEILEVIDHTPLADRDYEEHLFNYWQEVKEEINKL